MNNWNQVSTVAISRHLSRFLVSADNNRVIKIWDSQNENFCLAEFFDSSCNAICFTKDESTFCSGHDNGKIKFSTILSCRISHGSEMVVHKKPVTSICSLQGGNVMLTSGRDNLHNLVDVRSMRVCRKFRTRGNVVATKWSRTCVSPDENYVAVGSADGCLCVVHENGTNDEDYEGTECCSSLLQCFENRTGHRTGKVTVDGSLVQ